MHRWRLSEPSREEDDWLLEEEVLLLEMVEWGLLMDAQCSNEGTAMEALVLDSVSGERNTVRSRERGTADEKFLWF